MTGAGRSRRLLGNTLALGLGTLLGRLVAFVMIPLYTYQLTTAEYGTVDLIAATVDFSMPLVFLTIHEAVLRFTMVSGADPSRVLASAGAVFAAGCVLAGVTVPIARSVVASDLLLGWFYAVLLTQAAFLISGAWARGVGRVKSFAAGGVIQAVVLGTSNVVLLVGFGAGMAGYLASLALSYAAGVGWLLTSTKVWRQSGQFRVDRTLVRRMLAYSVPLVPNALMWWLMSTSSRWFIAHYDQISTVGLYGIANRIPVILLIGAQVFAQAWQLSAFGEAGSPDMAGFHAEVFSAFTSVMLVAVCLLAALTRPVLDLVVEQSFREAWVFVPWLLLAAMFSSFAGMFGTVYTAAMRTGGVLFSTILSGGVALLLNWLLIPRFGGLGAAWASVIAFAALWLYRVIDSRRLMFVRVPWLRFGASLAVLLAQFAALQLLHDQPVPMTQGVAVVMIIALNSPALWRVGRHLAGLVGQRG